MRHKCNSEFLSTNIKNKMGKINLKNLVNLTCQFIKQYEITNEIFYILFSY